MPAKGAAGVLDYIRGLTPARGGDGPSDRELVERFFSLHDETAFAALVRRHGPMVFRVCLRALGNAQDAEDAFQATFLVLARTAKSIRKRESVADWLYGVARHTALKARTTADRRRKRERRVARDIATDPLAEVTVREGQEILDQELSRLPPKYRAPLILCGLEGLTRDEAARRLGCPAPTIKNRLEEGRERLRKRLVKRGLSIPAALGTFLLTELAAPAAVPARLFTCTVKGATTVAAGQTALAAAVSAKAAALTEGVLQTMFTSRLKSTTAALTLLAAFAVGAGTLLYQAQAREPQEALNVARPASGANGKAQAAARPIVVKDGGQLLRVVWSADGKSVATLGYTFDVIELKDSGMKVGVASPTIKLWDATTGKLQRSLGEEKDRLVHGLAVSRDGQTAALAISGQIIDREKGGQAAAPGIEVRVMDAHTWGLKHQFTDRDVEMAVTALALSPDGKRLALGGFPHGSSAVAPVPQLGDEPRACLKLWDVANQKLIAQKSKQGEPPLKQMFCLDFSPDGNLLAAGDKDGTIRLFDGQSGKPRAVLKDERNTSGFAHKLAFSPDGKTLASVSQEDRDSTVTLWDVADAKRRQTLPGNRLWAVGFSRDGKVLATAGGVEQATGKWRYEVTLWNARSGAKNQTLPVDLTVPPLSLAFSPDGKTLAVAGGLLGDVKDGARTRGEFILIPLQ